MLNLMVVNIFGQKSFTVLSDFIECLNIDNRYNYEIFDGDRAINLDFDGVITLSEVSKIKFIKPNGESIEYKVVELGNVRRDSDKEINLNDVIYLRQAIVGIINKKDGYPEDFVLEASDTDLSNIEDGRQRELGDIGDVIAIRQRILNYKWNDM